MSLQVWLPLTQQDLRNQGLAQVTSSGTPSYRTPGKLSSNALDLKTRITFTCNALKNLQTFSVCFWGYAGSSSTLTTNWQDLLGFGDVSSSGTAGTFRWETTYASTNGIHWHDNATNALVNGSVTHVATKDTWCHCCVVFDKNAGKVYSYTNGVLTNTYDHLGGKFNANGTFYLGETNNIEGMIQDVRFYNHALSPMEVKAISQGLVLHYPLNNGGLGNKNLAKDSTVNTQMGSSPQLRTLTFSGWDNYCNQNLDLTAAEWNNLVGTKITYRMWLENVEQTVGTGTGIMLHFRYADGTYQQFGGGKNGVAGSWLAQGESGWVQLTVTIPDPTTRSNPTTISRVEYSIRHNSNNGASTVKYQYAKVELGDKATTWCPNPADAIAASLGVGGTTEYDCSGFGNNGTQGGSGTISYSSNTPKYSVCTQLIGATVDTTSNVKTGAAYITGPCSLSNITSLTVAWWAKINLYGRGGLMDLTAVTSNYEEGTDYNTCPLSNWDSTFRIWDGTNAFNFYSYVLKDSTWHHYVVTFSSGSGKFYRDGVNVANSSTMGSTLTNCNGIRFGLGKAGGVYRQIKEDMSDVRVYATALSADDVKSLYQNEAYIDSSGTIYGQIH